MRVEEEIWLMERFQKLYSRVTFEKPLKQESPDFISYSNGTKIGIEITEVFQDSASGNSKLQQYSADCSKLTDQLIDVIQPFINFKFTIGITFSKVNHIRKSTKNQLIQTLKNICVPAMINLNDHQNIDLESYYFKLPEEVEHIFISRFDNMDYSYNARPEGGIITDLTMDNIQPIIKQKEELLIRYTPCDQNWLIIREGNYFAGSFGKVKIQTPIESTFNKVFLLRTSKDEIIELK